MSDNKPTPEEALVHYGVKGMKWGVRRAYAEGVQFDVNMRRRVLDGTATRTDRFANAQTLRPGDFLKARSLRTKDATKARVERDQAHVDRVLSGKEHVEDTLRRLGGTSIFTLALGGMDVYRKPPAPGKK